MKEMKFIFLILSLSVVFKSSVDGYKILGIFPTRYCYITSVSKIKIKLKIKKNFIKKRCKSHFAIGHSVMKTLAQTGHEVHVVSPFPQKTPINNYHDIFLDYGDDGKFGC